MAMMITSKRAYVEVVRQRYFNGNRKRKGGIMPEFYRFVVTTVNKRLRKGAASAAKEPFKAMSGRKVSAIERNVMRGLAS